MSRLGVSIAREDGLIVGFVHLVLVQQCSERGHHVAHKEPQSYCEYGNLFDDACLAFDVVDCRPALDTWVSVDYKTSSGQTAFRHLRLEHRNAIRTSTFSSFSILRDVVHYLSAIPGAACSSCTAIDCNEFKDQSAIETITPLSRPGIALLHAHSTFGSPQFIVATHAPITEIDTKVVPLFIVDCFNSVVERPELSVAFTGVLKRLFLPDAADTLIVTRTTPAVVLSDRNTTPGFANIALARIVQFLMSHPFHKKNQSLLQTAFCSVLDNASIPQGLLTICQEAKLLQPKQFEAREGTPGFPRCTLTSTFVPFR